MRKQASILMAVLVGLFVLVGPGVAMAKKPHYPPCDKKAFEEMQHQEKKDFEDQQKADKRDFEDQQKADKDAFNSSPHTKDEKKAFEKQQHEDKKAFEEQQKSDKKDFEEMQKQDKKDFEESCKKPKKTSFTTPFTPPSKGGFDVTVGMIAIAALGIGSIVMIRRRRFHSLGR